MIPLQISLLQWLLVITAALLSGTVLIAVLTPALRNSQFSLFLIIGILSAHVVLAAGFLLYFFHSPETAASVLVKQTTLPPLAALPKAATPPPVAAGLPVSQSG